MNDGRKLPELVVSYESSKESVYLGTLQFIDSDRDLRPDLIALFRLILTYQTDFASMVELIRLQPSSNVEGKPIDSDYFVEMGEE